MESKKALRHEKGILVASVVIMSPLISSRQAAEIEKAFARGEKPIAGNPDHDWTLENMERQVKPMRGACLLMAC